MTDETVLERGRILVADDTALDLRVLEHVLTRRGYEVHTARDGRSALEQARALRPGLILLDIRMPDMDGYEVCARLKAEAATRTIPVMFISSGDALEDKVQAFASGGVDYIAKPVQRAEVLARVATHLALHGLQQDLEARVAHRTAELAEANARLTAQIDERRAAEEKFRAVLEACPEGMVIVDAQRRIALVNSRTEALFGYRRAELIGQPVELLVPERHREAHADLALAFMARPRLRPMGDGLNLHGRRRDGSEFPVEISLSPVRTGDGPHVIATVRDISDRRQAEAVLRELAAHRDAVREEERKHIAREIHDELGAALTALKMDLYLLRRSVGGQAEESETGRRLEQMREVLERTSNVVRQLATQLRPVALNLGLVPALEWLVGDFRERSGVACHLDAAGEVAMDDACATGIFRIVQESLTNVARHARASRVDVVLERHSGALELAVCDDGAGFDPEAVGSGSFGLLGIVERARNLGGTVAIDSAPGRGTRVAIRIPLQKGSP